MRRRRMRETPVVGAMAFLVVALAFAGATAASAHSEYARSEPAVGVRIPRAPDRVDVWFTQELFRRSGANTLEVSAADGRRLDEGDALIDPADRTHLSIGLVGQIEEGVVRVGWRSLSALDGDTAEGSFEFTIDPSAPEPTAAATTGAESGPGPALAPASAFARGGGSLWWMLIALPAVLASGGIAIQALRAPFDEARR